MRNLFRVGLVLCFLMGSSYTEGFGQDTLMVEKALHAPDKLVDQVDKKTKAINEQMVKQTGKYMNALRKQEEKLRKKVAAIDLVAAMQVFNESKKKYADLQHKMEDVSSQVSRFSGGYVPHLDSLKTAFDFMGKSSALLKATPELENKLQEALKGMGSLQNRFAQVEEVKRFLKQRQAVLTEQLSKYNVGKELKAYRKQVYYYQQQVTEYKQILKDPSKLEARALSLLQQSDRFKEFFSRHSQLAAMFRIPTGSSHSAQADLVSLTGHQTRASVMEDMVQKFGSEARIQEVLSVQAHDIQSQLNQLKDKVAKMGGSGSEDPMPEFKPNHQKTKSFLQRLEIGTSLQNIKGNGFFPSSTDLGLSVGYKLNDKSIIGFGGSYRMGWSKDIKHLKVTHQGMGLRSFVDYKLKGSIWLSGGGELNYRSQFRNFDILNDYSAWQKSALLGLSKRYQVGKKLKGNMQVLYDFLWRDQVIKTQPVVFRFGYTLK